MAINSENGDGDLQGLAEQGGAPLHHIQIPEVDHTRSPWVRSSEWRLLSRQRYFTEQLEDWKSFRRWQVLARRGCLAEIEECVPPEAQAFNYFLCVFSGNAGSYPAAAKLLLEESGQVVEVEFRPMYEAANQSMLTEWLEYLVYACAMEYRCKQLATQLWGPLSGVAKAWRLLRDEKVIDQSQEDSFNAAPEEAYKAVQNDVNELTFLRGVLRAKLAAADASGENTWVNFERNQIFQQVEWADRSLKLAIRRKLQVEVFRRCGSNEDRLRRQSLRVGWIRSQLDRLRADGPVAALPSRIIQSSPALPVQGPVSPFGAPSRSDVRIREGNIARPGLVQPNRQYVGDGLWLPYNFTNLHHELPLELGVNSGGGSAVASSSTAPAGPSAPGRYSVAPQSRTTNGYLTTTVYNITHLLPELGGDGNWAITLDTSAADGQVRPALSAGGSLVTLLDASDVSGLPTVAAFGSDNNHNRTILPGSGASTVSPSPAPESTATAAAASFKEIPVPQLPTRPPLPRLPTSRFPETALSPMPSLPTVIPTTPASPRPIPSEPFVTRHALLPLRPVPTRPGRSNKALSSGASACAQERTGNIAQPESSSQAAKRPLSATGDDDDQQPPRGSKRRPISIGDNAGQGNSDRGEIEVIVLED